MSITVDAKILLDGIKKVIRVTNASSLNFYFKDNNVKISSVINQYQMELNLPIECQEEMKFCILIGSLLPILEGKKSIDFTLEGTILKFKSGRTKGELVTLAYEDYTIEDNKGEPLDLAIKNYIFNNLYRVNFLGKNVSDSILLQVEIKGSKIKMLSMEAYYSGLVVDDVIEGSNASFNILLKYANLITEIFNINDDLKIVTTSSNVTICSSTCKVVLPRIAEDEANSIEQMEDIIKQNVVEDDLKGMILIQQPSNFIADIDELRTFVANEKVKALFIRGKDQDVVISVESPSGVLKKKLEGIKVKGEIDSQFNIESFRTCLEKNLEGVLKLSFYSNFCTLKTSKFKDSIYIVLETK